MELRDQLTQRGGQLSGGYKRRLQVAKALMVETPVLFLDEATTGMDPMAKGRTMQAIRDQAKAGRTVLLTTQLLEEAESLCDRMILLDEGRSMAEGKLSELRAMARKSFTIGLGFATPDRAAVDALRGMGPVSLEERGGEVSMVVEGSEDQWIRNMARISERWPLVHFEIRGVTLEQIFIQMYGDARRARAEAPSFRGTVGGGGNGGATRAQESGPSEHGGGSPGTSGGSPPADPDRGGRGSR
jgi:ABC-2 type transport system ATP-binding protein